MARYKDCDKCYHRLVCAGDTDKWNYYGECPHYINAADVVPKSEVERLEEKCAILNEKNAQLALALFRDFPTTKELEVWEACEAVKTKVAREIFEEIEESISSLEYIARTPRKTVSVEELKSQVDWVLHDVVLQTIAELKKKYTEDK